MSRLGQPARFALVGAGGYLASIAAFAALFAVGVRYAAASVLAYFLSNAGMYVGNRYFTFRLGHARFWTSYARYVLVGSVVAGSSALLLALLVEGVDADPRVAQAIALAAVTPVAYVLSRRFAFQPRPA